MTALRIVAYFFLCVLGSACVGAADSAHPRLLLTGEEVRANTPSWQESALFARTIERLRARVDAQMNEAPDVPYPRDAGGGYTHEQHKRNGVSIHDAGMLYQWTGDPKYLAHTRSLLLAYAKLYPQLGEHPEKKEQSPGRLFWQSLNEAVWLVYAIQGYDAVLTALTAQDKTAIETGLLHPLAQFLSVQSPQTFNKIHNHGTWATAAVGMTGYVLDKPGYVETALKGLSLDGSGGFLRQLDELFSPDGYYNEGPYYQRYALMPFVVFAKAIEQNDPQRRIFQHRDNILQKAIYSAIHLSYGGKFFPLNDAIKDKGLNTVELDYAIAIAYGLTGDDSLLSLVTQDSNLVPTIDGLRVARAKEAGRTQPFEFDSLQLRDGAAGDRGALSVLRSGYEPEHTAVVFKATAQGLGHGHFDRLNWIYYDNGAEVVSDYGAARFLNVVQKNGGHYLPENTTWAKQTVAHNTLVVDERSHFDAKVKIAERTAPDQQFFAANEHIQIASAREPHAYRGVSFDRTVAMITAPELDAPLVLDVLRARSEQSHQYDLPLYYQGQMIASSAVLKGNEHTLLPVGKSNGYQHLWRLGETRVGANQPFAFTWLLGNRFYTYTAMADGALDVLLTQTGASDPNFNLRRESGLMLRVAERRSDVTLVGLLEAHGEYNGAAEYTLRSDSQIERFERFSENGNEVIRIETQAGSVIALALSFDPNPKGHHMITLGSVTREWSGFYGLWRE